MSLDGDTLNLIFAAGGFLVGLFALWLALFGYGGYKARLENEPPIQDKAARALTAPGPLTAYLRTLEIALDALNGWMGKRARLMPEDGDPGAWGGSLNWCLTLAMIYPFVFFLVSWLFGGTGTVGAFEFLPQPGSMSAWQRFALVAYLLLIGAGLFYLVRNQERIDKAASDWLDRNLWQRFPSTHRQKAKLLLPLSVGATLFAIFYIGLGLPLALAVALAGAEGAAANTFSATFLLFFLLLPFINALFDWASWQVSRWLGDNLLTISKMRGYPSWKRAAHYLKDIVIDGGFAVACLIGLAWAIPRVIEAFNAFLLWFTGESIFQIGDYLCAAATQPLGDGLWATSMLFSTLLPTAAHFSFLIFAPIFWGISWLFGAHITDCFG
ncbi:MAG: hypothetical protein AAF543_19200 [Pseudomonadota bacterium]